uniref:Apple domain-containing protein n=1 Tax=Plectus sambesii TaxID=2011161 RepID=A0A914UZW9_9BILA
MQETCWPIAVYPYNLVWLYSVAAAVISTNTLSSSPQQPTNWIGFCASLTAVKDIASRSRKCRCSSEKECAPFAILKLKGDQVCDDSSFVPKGANPFRLPPETARCTDTCVNCFGNATAACPRTGGPVMSGLLCICRNHKGKLLFLSEGDRYTH